MYKAIKRLALKAKIKRVLSKPEDKMLKYLRRHWRTSDVPAYYYRQFDVKKIPINYHNMFRVRPKKNANEKAVFFVAGGGGMISPTPCHFRMAARIVKKTNAMVYIPLYPLSPEFRLFTSSGWLLYAYKYVQARHREITIVSDSAGASMAAYLCSLQFEQPRCLVMISPGLDVDGKDPRIIDASERDLFFTPEILEKIKYYRLWEIKETSPMFSPLYVSYRKFPPILLYYGTNEIFYPRMQELIEKIRAGGAPLKVHVGNGLFHDWVIVGMFKESLQAQDEIISVILNPPPIPEGINLVPRVDDKYLPID